VTASSSASDSAPDFAVDRVVDGWPGKPEHEWTSSGERQGAWLKLEWPRPVRVDRIVLYDRPNVIDNVTSGALFVDDDPEPIATSALAPDGAATPVAVGDRSVRTLTFVVTGATGRNA